MEGELDGFVRVIRIENKELSDFAEARQPFALGLNKLYGLFGFGHSMFFAEFLEKMEVLLGEELFDNESEGVAIKILPLIIFGPLLRGWKWRWGRLLD